MRSVMAVIMLPSLYDPVCFHEAHEPCSGGARRAARSNAFLHWLGRFDVPLHVAADPTDQSTKTIYAILSLKQLSSLIAGRQ